MTLQDELTSITKECMDFRVILGEVERILSNHDSICPMCKIQGVKEKVKNRYDLTVLRERVDNILRRVRIIRERYGRRS
jgi:hypothetical protein